MEILDKVLLQVDLPKTAVAAGIGPNFSVCNLGDVKNVRNQVKT
jgi:hypothetical protein